MKKILYGSGIVIVTLLIASGFFINQMIKKSFPKIEGLNEVKSIKSEIKIFRDDNGIPFIEAKNEEDAYFALGYCHAQDRLWQMDLLFRTGAGQLSEIFGSETIDIDKMSKFLSIEKLAQNLFQNSSPETKNILSAYSNGINAFIQQSNGNFPVEFDILGYKPTQWSPYKSILISRVLAWTLNLSWWTDGVFSRIAGKVPNKKLNQLVPSNSTNSYTIFNSIKNVSDNYKNSNSITYAFHQNNDVNVSILTNSIKKLNQLIGFSISGTGSNSWVVSGKKTINGKPILANDPHLAYTLPSVWYIASIEYPNNKIIGVSIAGCPSIIIGRNENISWGMTNLMLDDCDFFKETTDFTNDTYLVSNEYKKIISRIDTIYIKDENPIIFETKSTVRGPLLLNLDSSFIKTDKNSNFSLRWTGFEKSDEVKTFSLINKAKNYKEFKEALKYYGVPAQNFLYADKEDNTFYQVAGLIPMREYNPLFIQNGFSNNDWKGFFNFEDLPNLLNSANSFIANCNNPPSKDFENVIGNLWEPNSRIERIKFLLEQKEKYSVDDMKIFQNDIFSTYAQKIVIHILNAFNKVQIKDKNLQNILTYFRNWNYEINKNDQVSLIYNSFLNELIRNTFSDEMGSELFNDFVYVGNIPLRAIGQLLENEENAISISQIFSPDSTNVRFDSVSYSWFDNVTTKKIETKTEIIRKSLIDAISMLETTYGYEPKNWIWGKAHSVRFRHPLSSKSEILSALTDIGPYEINGDQTTLSNASYKICKSFNNTVGSSMRFISDLSTDEINIIITLGQSGQILHNNYSDQNLKWLRGDYIKLNLSSKNKENLKCLILKPI